jgi:hypothetical protein
VNSAFSSQTCSLLQVNEEDYTVLSLDIEVSGRMIVRSRTLDAG